MASTQRQIHAYTYIHTRTYTHTRMHPHMDVCTRIDTTDTHNSSLQAVFDLPIIQGWRMVTARSSGIAHRNPSAWGRICFAWSEACRESFCFENRKSENALSPTHTHTHTFRRTHTHPHTHTQSTHTHRHPHAHIRTHIYTHTHTQPSHTHSRAHRQTHTHIHTYLFTPSFTHKHTLHTHILHTHTLHTHTLHTHMCVRTHAQGGLQPTCFSASSSTLQFLAGEISGGSGWRERKGRGCRAPALPQRQREEVPSSVAMATANVRERAMDEMEAGSCDSSVTVVLVATGSMPSSRSGCGWQAVIVRALPNGKRRQSRSEATTSDLLPVGCADQHGDKGFSCRYCDLLL